MDADGTQDGFDLELIRAVRREVTIPVIASGGAGRDRALRARRRRRRRRRAGRDRLPLRHAADRRRQAVAGRGRSPGALSQAGRSAGPQVRDRRGRPVLCASRRHASTTSRTRTPRPASTGRSAARRGRRRRPCAAAVPGRHLGTARRRTCSVAQSGSARSSDRRRGSVPGIGRRSEARHRAGAAAAPHALSAGATGRRRLVRVADAPSVTPPCRRAGGRPRRSTHRSSTGADSWWSLRRRRWRRVVGRLRPARSPVSAVVRRSGSRRRRGAPPRRPADAGDPGGVRPGRPSRPSSTVAGRRPSAPCAAAPARPARRPRRPRTRGRPGRAGGRPVPSTDRRDVPSARRSARGRRTRALRRRPRRPSTGRWSSRGATSAAATSTVGAARHCRRSRRTACGRRWSSAARAPRRARSTWSPDVRRLRRRGGSAVRVGGSRARRDGEQSPWSRAAGPSRRRSARRHDGRRGRLVMPPTRTACGAGSDAEVGGAQPRRPCRPGRRTRGRRTSVAAEEEQHQLDDRRR